VRSTELDDFDESLFLWFESLGNEKNNQRWEAELPATIRRPLDNPHASPECLRRWWLREKCAGTRLLALATYANHSPLTTHRSPLTAHPSPLTTTHHSPPLTTHHHLRYDEMRFLAGSEHAGRAHTTMRGWLGKQGSVLPAAEP
jgi:hypothetical protein